MRLKNLTLHVSTRNPVYIDMNDPITICTEVGDLKELRVTLLVIKVVLKKNFKRSIAAASTFTVESRARMSILSSSCIKMVYEVLKKNEEIKFQGNANIMISLI